MQLNKFLEELSLNKYEKEVVVFLAGISGASASEIYRETKVPKGRIYSILGELQEKGFVKCIPSRPKRYVIEDVKQSIKNYLEKKKSFVNDQLSSVDEIIVNPKGGFDKGHPPSAFTFSGREEHLAALTSLRNTAKKEILQMAPLFIGTHTSNRSMIKAINRGVSICIIIRKVTSENKSIVKEVLSARGQVRFFDSDKLGHLFVRDGEEVLLGLDNYQNKEERLVLLTNNLATVLAMKEYFEKLWRLAKPIRFKESKVKKEK